MGILRDFEKRLEGAVEGFFARAFRSGLQPVELAKALQRYAGNYQQVGLDGVFVPNVYRFELAPDDYGRFEGFADSLKAELAGVVKRTAADRGWRLQGPVRIELRRADAVTVGTYELRGKIESGAHVGARAPAPTPAPAPAPRPDPVPRPPVAATAAEDGGRTVLMPRPGSALASLRSAEGRRYALGSTATVGRLPECEVTLDDPSVSRRHARITSSGTRWSVEDLGSTNGLKVNGDRVGSAVLADGDRLELGTVELTFSLGS